MEEKKIQKPSFSSPFIGRSDGVVFEGQKFVKPSEDLIFDYEEVAEVVKTGEGKHDFIINKKLVPVSKQVRRAFINSFSGDVGILNVLKKVAIGGKSISDAIEAGIYASKQGYVDLTQMPDNIVDAYKAVEKGVQAFDKLPEALKKKQSFAKFATDTGRKEITEFIAGEVKKAIAAASKPKGEEKHE